MRRFFGSTFAAVVLCTLAMATGSSISAQEKAIPVSPLNAEMNAAVAKARTTLPTFWASLDKPKPGETGFALKVKISGGGKNEHFWLINIDRKGNSLAGTINNKPNIVMSVKEGQRHQFTERDISDWMFMRNGKIVGNETMRPLLKTLPKEKADQYRRMLEKP